MSETDDTHNDELSLSPDWYDGHVRAEQAPDDVREAFENMRDFDLVTVEGESCCTSCASHNAHSVAGAVGADGYAAYNEQSVDDWYGEFYVAFGGVEGVQAEVVGAHVASAIDAVDGLSAEWDGDVGTCVKLTREQWDE